MILTVAPDTETISKIRRRLCGFPLFSYFSTIDKFYDAVYEHRPTLLILRTDEFDHTLMEAIAWMHRRLPLVRILTLTDRPTPEVPSLLSELGVLLPTSSTRRVVLYFLFKLAPKTRNSSADTLSLIAKGLYMDPFSKVISIYGVEIQAFNAMEGFILRFIGERYPTSPTLDEIATACAPYGQRLSRATVLKYISSISAKIQTVSPGLMMGVDEDSHTVTLLAPCFT